MKKKGLALAVCIAFASPSITVAETFSGIAALNLGEIESSSYLAEPFRGSIPILYTSTKEASLLKVRLASSIIFKELGVDKSHILKSLSFKVQVSNNKPYVAIRSSQAIDLPFLSFVLEIYGPEGSIYQDYTVLLDPRSYSKNNSKRSSTSLSINESSLTSASQRVLAPVVKSRPTRVRVKSGDTLSGIANTVKLNNISNKRMARAIFLKNPRAFSGNSANKLKKGVTLKIPELNDILSIKSVAIKKTAGTTQTALSKSSKPSTTEPLVDQTTSKIKLALDVTSNDKVTSGANVAVNKAVSADKLTQSYTVKSGDSLSAIARKFTSKSASFSKMMSVIHNENPHAFTNNKVNLLKKGAVLTVSVNGANKQASNDNSQVKPDASEQEFSISTYKVKKGDSLSAIVKKLNYEGVSSRKVMNIIFTSNPEAFDKNNITIIKVGAVLSLRNLEEFKKAAPQATQLSVADTKIEAAINLSLDKLERRLRQIRKELKRNKSALFDLNLTLKNKDMLLERQSKDIKILKKKLTKLDSANTDTNSKEILSTATVVTSTDINNPEKIVPNDEMSLTEIISYSGLAFLVGLMLLRVGRQKYADRMVASDDYIPMAKIDPQMQREKLDFNKTLIKTEDEKNSEITDASIQECERLVEELVDELDYKTATVHHDNQVEKEEYIQVDQIKESVPSSPNNHYVEDHFDFQSFNQKVAIKEDNTIDSPEIIKADILSSFEETLREKSQPEPSVTNTKKKNQRNDLETLEIDLERHLQSINDEIAAKKMKDLV